MLFFFFFLSFPKFLSYVGYFCRFRSDDCNPNSKFVRYINQIKILKKIVIWMVIFFNFFYMFTQGKREKFKLITSVLLSVT